MSTDKKKSKKTEPTEEEDVLEQEVVEIIVEKEGPLELHGKKVHNYWFILSGGALYYKRKEKVWFPAGYD